MEPKDIKELLEMVDAAQIAELEIEHGDFKIRIRKFAREASLPVVETPFVPRPSEPSLLQHLRRNLRFRPPCLLMWWKWLRRWWAPFTVPQLLMPSPM